MKKRNVKPGYVFSTRPCYSRWQVRVIQGPLEFVEGWNPYILLVLDHRFMRDGVWEWLTCRWQLPEQKRDVVAHLLRGMRSSIIRLKQAQGKSA